MTKHFKFAWIDDDVARASGYSGGLNGTLNGENVEVGLEPIEVTASLFEDLSARIENQWFSRPPDLIMLDHSFSRVAKRLFDVHGSGLAHLLRIRLPKTPIVCVTGQGLSSDGFNSEDLSEYTFLFDVNHLNDETTLERLFSIANDFNRVCFPEKLPIRGKLIDALGTPDIDRSSLLTILPQEFESHFVHGTSPHRTAKWVFDVLIERPGFLYDTLHTATLLGLNESSFKHKVAHLFDEALYKGPFATKSQPRWWVSSVAEVLYTMLPACSRLSTQDAGRKLPNIAEADFSVCGVTNEHSPAPDVVAFTDDTGLARLPVRHVFTMPSSDTESATLGFPTRLKIRNPRRGG